MCPTLKVGSFFRHERSTFLFLCSTTSNLNNSNLRSASKTKRKNKTDVQNLENTKDPPITPLFSALWDFLKLFGLHQRVPLHLFRYFATQWMSKIAKGPPFYIFRHCDTVQKSHLKNFFMSPKGPPSIFFILCNQPEFHKARRSPFSILSLRYGADFGRSRLVLKTPPRIWTVKWSVTKCKYFSFTPYYSD